MKKMNNKGFSLVELIVVVLIMAIIAVALAPQVMKWVENSRVSTDATNYESLIENLQLAIADKDVYKEISAASGSMTVTIKPNAIELGSGTHKSTPQSSMPTHTASGTPTQATVDDFINWSLTKIDASWDKLVKKASGEPTSGKDYYEITVTFGKQANVARVYDQSPDKLKTGTDLS